MRGAPGSGKSSWIKEHGLEPYTLSADQIRLQCQSPELNVYGGEGISMKNDPDVWSMLFRMLEIRMSHGEFTVIDATNSKTVEMKKYKELATAYRYRIYIVDMTDMDINVVKLQNSQREPFKRVPEYVIDKMYSRFATQNIPSGITPIGKDDFDKVKYQQLDLSNYKIIHHIGDIHGCYTSLCEYLLKSVAGNDTQIDYVNGKFLYTSSVGGGAYVRDVPKPKELADFLSPDEFYIFVGDYTDRGIENVEVLQFLSEIYKMNNVQLLEGNHEIHLRNWLHDATARSSQFNKVTKPYLENAVHKKKLNKKTLRQVYRKLGQVIYYKYKDKNVLVTHGGLSNIGENLLYVATEQMISGVGQYEEYSAVIKSFEQNNPDIYQVNGHRNLEDVPIQASNHCFNLEGGVEFGGELRAVKFTDGGFETVAIKNEVFGINQNIENVQHVTSENLILSLRDNKHVNEKMFDNISSFNFTREAFNRKIWDEQTIKARGLFLDNETNKIICRGYSKFFNINERPSTRLNILKHRLTFPIKAYVKENGFLAMVSYDEKNDDFLICSKSVPQRYSQEEDIINCFTRMFSELSKEQLDSIKNYIKNNNVTLLFECCDIDNDPHIIEYEKSKIVLLDVVKNDINFEHLDYDSLVQTSNYLNLECKTLAYTFNTWPEFIDWYYKVTDENNANDKIEGYVIEDSDDYMVKLKLPYYNKWKFLRGVADCVARKGYFNKTGSLFDKECNDFYGWVKDEVYKDRQPNDKKPRINIIKLREQFYEVVE